MMGTVRRVCRNLKRWGTPHGVALDGRWHDGGSQRFASIESLQAPAGSQSCAQLINASTSLNRTVAPHSMIHGNACFAYFKKM
jgi:hypothetical protein